MALQRFHSGASSMHAHNKSVLRNDVAGSVGVHGALGTKLRCMTSILAQYTINVTDIERSIKFWDEVIGIPLVSRTEIPNCHEAIHQSPHGGSRLQIAEHTDRTGPIDMGTAMWKIYVNTDDCQALYDRAIAAGCESVQAPQRLERWPVVMAFVKDHDGYLLEFVEYIEGTNPGVPDPKKVGK